MESVIGGLLAARHPLGSGARMFDRLKIGTVLSLGFVAVLAAALGIALAAWQGLGAVGQGMTHLPETIPSLSVLDRLDRTDLGGEL